MNEQPNTQETPDAEPAETAEEEALPMTDVALLVRIRDGLREQL